MIGSWIIEKGRKMMNQKNKFLNSMFILFFTFCLAGLNPWAISMKCMETQPASPMAEHSHHSGFHHQDKGSHSHNHTGKNRHGDCAGHVSLISSCCMSATLAKAVPALPSFDLHNKIFSNYLCSLFTGIALPPFHPPIHS